MEGRIHRGVKEWQKVELEQAYKQSILDKLWEKIKQLTKKEDKNE
jgi:hypothetical protein